MIFRSSGIMNGGAWRRVAPVAWCLKKRSAYSRLFSTRIECEDKYHIGRALSRSTVEAKEQKKWESMTRNWSTQWNGAAFEQYLHSSPKYEFEALESIHKKSYQANVLLEIRDVRLPGSSHHPSFTRLAKHRLHLICYTHADMIDAKTRDRVERWTDKNWPDSRSIFVDTRQNRSEAEAFDVVYDGLLHHVETKGGINTALTVGVANTGKSSLLQCLLRNAKARGLIKKQVKVKVGEKKKNLKKSGGPAIEDTPGKTRVLTEYMIREKPRAFFLDVPGVTPPQFFFRERPGAWYGYGVANLLPMSKNMKADPALQTAFCEYLLFCLNRDKNFCYVKKIGLEAPTENVHDVLVRFANKYAERLPEDQLTLKRCTNFLKLFNTGNLGPVILDDLSRRYEQFRFQDEHFHREKGEDDDGDYEDY